VLPLLGTERSKRRPDEPSEIRGRLANAAIPDSARFFVGRAFARIFDVAHVESHLFEGMGFVAPWSVIKDISTGNATSRGSTINVKENPGGFYLIVFFKAVLSISPSPSSCMRSG
jgi:hypothetical protein